MHVKDGTTAAKSGVRAAVVHIANAKGGEGARAHDARLTRNIKVNAVGGVGVSEFPRLC